VTQRTLTVKGQATRQRIVEGAAAAIRANGVAATSLDDIRAATGTSKSQLFHYFPDGRAELLRAVTRHEAERVLDDQQPHLCELTSWPAWQRWRDLVVTRYREQGRQCPLGTLHQQLGPDDPAADEIVTDLLHRWQAALTTGVRAMQAAGEVAAGVDAERTAAALLAGLQGGVVMLLATGSTANLEAALDLALDRMKETR
jgi:AcrR family transcriptional regulator